MKCIIEVKLDLSGYSKDDLVDLKAEIENALIDNSQGKDEKIIRYINTDVKEV